MLLLWPNVIYLLNNFNGHLVIELLILIQYNHKTFSVMGGEVLIA